MIYTPFNNGDENIYAGQVVAVSRGNIFNGDYSLALPWIGPLILGSLTRLTGSVEAVFILADFILPALIFYLLYQLAREFKSEPGLAVLGSLASIFLYQLLTKINPLDWLEPMFFNFNRLIPPQLTFVFFLLFLLSFVRLTSWSGILAGLLAYVYFYHWTAALVILAVRRRWRELILAGLISSPYIYLALTASPDQALRFGRLNGHFFEPLTTVRYLFMIGLVFWSSLAKKIKQFFYGLFVSAIGLMNLQFVTGFTIAPGHWPSSTFEPLVPFTLVLVFKRYLKKFWPILLGLILIYGLINQVRISWQWRQMYYLSAKDKAIINEINNFSGRPTVITLDKRLNFYLPLYAQARLYLPYGSYSKLSNNELWQRWLCAIQKNNLSELEIDEVLTDTQMIGHLFDLTFNQGLTVFSFGKRKLPENKIIEAKTALKQDLSCPSADLIIINGKIYETSD